MKMKLLRPQQPPYGGGYRLDQPAKGMVGFGTNFDMLEKNVRNYRLAMGMPTGLGFAEELQQEICAQYPQECEYTDPNLPTQIRLGFDDMVHGTKVIASLKLSGSGSVPKEEAIRRGEICSRCKLCVPFQHPCTGLCGELKTIVDSMIGSYETPFDGDLRGCGICHCYYSSHIRVPYVHLEKGLTDKMKAEFQAANQAFRCWKIAGAV